MIDLPHSRFSPLPHCRSSDPLKGGIHCGNFGAPQSAALCRSCLPHSRNCGNGGAARWSRAPACQKFRRSTPSYRRNTIAFFRQRIGDLRCIDRCAFLRGPFEVCDLAEGHNVAMFGDKCTGGGRRRKRIRYPLQTWTFRAQNQRVLVDDGVRSQCLVMAQTVRKEAQRSSRVRLPFAPLLRMTRSSFAASTAAAWSLDAIAMSRSPLPMISAARTS